MHRSPFSSRFALPLLGLAVLLAVPLELTAAPSPLQRFSSPHFDHAAINLLYRPGVMKELGVDPATYKPSKVGLEAPTRMRKIGMEVAKMKERGASTRDRIVYENTEKERFYVEVTQSVLGQLTPPQVDRLRQIALQHFGPQALANPAVAKAAQLSPQTAKKISQISDEFDRISLSYQQGDFRQRRALVEAGVGLTPEEQARYREIRSKGMGPKEMREMMALEKKSLASLPVITSISNRDLARHNWNRQNTLIEAALSPAERQRWQRLQGKPFPIPRFEGLSE